MNRLVITTAGFRKRTGGKLNRKSRSLDEIGLDDPQPDENTPDDQIP